VVGAIGKLKIRNKLIKKDFLILIWKKVIFYYLLASYVPKNLKLMSQI
jgi:hypothetical protein